MKILITTILLIIIGLGLRAQSNLLGKSQAVVIQKMSIRNDVKFLTKSYADYGSLYLSYIDPDLIGLCYYFKNDTCYLYKVIYPMKYLTNIIGIANKENIRVNESTWSSKDLFYKTEVIYDEKKGMFWLNISKM
jgi:hypothetical protein